jgi:small conductance mechanosensitive channel
VSGMAAALQSAIGLMREVELDGSEYEAQVLLATGEITTDILKPAVIIGLFSDWWDGALASLAESLPSLLFNLLLFFLIVFIARKLAKVVERLVGHSLAKSQLRFSELLKRMIISMARNTVMILGVLIALSQIGITLGPLLAGLGVAGFVIGFALQDTLSNFASGMMILLYRPFDVGDLVEAGSVFGTVHRMSLVNTTILTLDNQTIVVPNNKIWGDVIRNVTHQSTRRVDITFGVSYTDDIAKTERILAEIVDSHKLILKQPEAVIRLHELADSSVNFVVRAWTKTEDYWDVYWDLMRGVKLRFDEEGISIPFPQRDVHFYPQTPALVTEESVALEPDVERSHIQGRAQISDTED